MPRKAVKTSMLKAQPMGRMLMAKAPKGAAATVMMPVRLWLRPMARGRKCVGTRLAKLATAAGYWIACSEPRMKTMTNTCQISMRPVRNSTISSTMHSAPRVSAAIINRRRL